MARPPRADYRRIMVDVVKRKLIDGEEIQMREIAEELDVSTSLINFYFGDRQQLVDAAWRSILETNIEEDVDAVASFVISNDWDGVRELVLDVFSAERTNFRQTELRAVVEARRNPALADMLREIHDATVDQWTSLLNLAAEAGMVAPQPDPEAFARYIIAVPMAAAVYATEMTDEQRMAFAETWFRVLRSALDPAMQPDVSPPGSLEAS